MDRTPGGGRTVMGAVGTCFFRSCIGVLGVCLVLVTAFWIWAATAPGRNEDKARADMRAGADAHKERLARAAADGRLTDAELAAEFPPGGPSRGLLAVERKAGSVRLTAGLAGTGPGFLLASATFVDGCYVFDVSLERGVGARVTARESSAGTCGGLTPVFRRPTPPAAPSAPR
ncbi:hypothetical protein [Streptomyces sp. IBSNAI001]|uniref:hypothetical protein n=1 Tax=Streptomyces sp. IBSNAI001 TaxID=3457499 RepID=UPI003FCFC405